MKAQETRQFSMHAKLLFDTISRQAGTLSKAILEGVMNAVDAQATHCTIQLAPKTLQIVDDGVGFKSRQEIEQNFEVFGQPHEATEGKLYGTFRMGRGQLFAFGHNTWRTGPFKMVVDFKNWGIKYELEEGLREAAGCKIDVKLYREQLPSELHSTMRDLERMCKWIAIPVTVNDKVISKDPAKAPWDHVTAEAYVKLKETGGLHVYNLGAWVFELPGYHMGSGGEVVSKKQLKVNFARNTVQDDCPVWSKIKPFLNRQARKRIARKPVLTDAERQRMADLLAQGEPVPDVGRLKLFTDCTGQHWSLNQLRYKRGLNQISVAPEGSIKGDRLMQAGAAFVFSEETLERFDVRDVVGLQQLITHLEPNIKVRAVSFEELGRGLSERSFLLHEHELTPKERAILNTMRHGISAFTWDAIGPRSLNIGKSDTKDGWTDGKHYIVVSRAFLKQAVGNGGGPEAWVRVGHLLLHEYAHHDDADTKTLVHHGPEFYREVHDRYDEVGAFVARAYPYWPKALEQANVKLSKWVLQSQDHASKAQRRTKQLAAAVELRRIAAATKPKD